MRQKGFVPILILLVAVGLGLVAYFGLFYESPKLVPSQDTSSPTPTVTVSPSSAISTPKPSTTSNIYTRVNGFSFTIPDGWTEQKNYSIQPSDGSMTIWIEGDSAFGLECLNLDKNITKVVGGKTLKMAYYSGDKSENCDTSDKRLIFIPLEAMNEKFSFSFSYYAKDTILAEKVFDQILSTFKFTQ